MSEVMSRPAAVKTLLLNPADNVAVALNSLDVGVDTPEGVKTTKRVPRGHKFTVKPVKAGEAIVKFGQTIGFAKTDLPAGKNITQKDVFLAIPGQPGQLVANDLSKYCEYKLLAPIVAKAPVMKKAVDGKDRRTEVEKIIAQAVKLLKKSGVTVPGQLDLEISHHYGIERFHEAGSMVITVVNRAYCKRLILLVPGQTHPEQWHKLEPVRPTATAAPIQRSIQMELNCIRRFNSRLGFKFCGIQNRTRFVIPDNCAFRSLLQTIYIAANCPIRRLKPHFELLGVSYGARRKSRS